MLHLWCEPKDDPVNTGISSLTIAAAYWMLRLRGA